MSILASGPPPKKLLPRPPPELTMNRKDGNMATLTGRKALVTGGASGTGKATAEKLRISGCDVAVLDGAGEP